MIYQEEKLQKSKTKYGEYLETYVSENELVKVHLFVDQGYIVPFAIFKPPHDSLNNVDNWEFDVDEIAKAHGYEMSGIVYWWA